MQGTLDVPGESLRLVVMEVLPWPRRRVHSARGLPASAYDDLLGRPARAGVGVDPPLDDRGVSAVRSPPRDPQRLPPGSDYSLPLD